MTKSEVLSFLTDNKEYFHAKYGVVKLGLFGSYARGEQSAESDIDIAVEIESQNKFRSFLDLSIILKIICI